MKFKWSYIFIPDKLFLMNIPNKAKLIFMEVRTESKKELPCGFSYSYLRDKYKINTKLSKEYLQILLDKNLIKEHDPVDDMRVFYTNRFIGYDHD